jgi:hypothetical protein
MSGLFRLALAVLCVAFGVFCAFGFLSASEAGDAANSVRLVYSLLAVGFVAVAVWLARPARTSV